MPLDDKTAYKDDNFIGKIFNKDMDINGIRNELYGENTFHKDSNFDMDVSLNNEIPYSDKPRSN